MTVGWNKSRRRKDCLFLFFIILAAGIMTAVYITAGRNNYGMEGDEVFSYISSTAMGGFKQICFLDDQTWYHAEYFKDALTATGEECFNIKMVVENQAMDTHPPLYYLFLNFVCSVFSGQFSVWFGIGLNIFFMILAGISLYLLLQYFLNNRFMALFLSMVFCCSELSVNMVLFIRMYVLLMALVVFQSWYHMKLYDRVLAEENGFTIKRHVKHYLLLMLITILGALTHYYFLIYQCLIAAIYVLGLWLHKRYRDVFRYIGTMAVSGGIYVCLYPAMLNHVFFKYRGREAVHKFLKEGTVFGDVISMFGEFNDQLFKGWLLPICLLLLLLTAFLIIRKKVEWRAVGRGLILILPSFIYFFGISKASPYVSIRYVSPVAPLLFTALAVWAKYLTEHMNVKALWQRRSCMAVCLILFLTSFYFFDSPVKSSYFAERKAVVDELAREADYCVYITADEYNWKMWEDYVNYPLFEGLFFIDGRYKNPITDDKLKEQDRLVIYIDKALDQNEIYEYLKEYLSLSDYEIKYETSYTYIVMAK